MLRAFSASSASHIEKIKLVADYLLALFECSDVCRGDMLIMSWLQKCSLNDQVLD